ncbi:NAD(P)-dependent dehydrogenase (short-subunit alcohol dehydrogenase family) [Microbacterium sp. SLBN-154]|uniref:SDR family NAD(P)-dependent oxidoreductase n=1 Tax=Microbacterium sp. SLBN-154 TaxID=2768458 RepID=UPI001151CF21|nr:SDR family NAD(P)-dependent oxidoreductase [Microbacterium sp. SLBN-154]TQK17639.1 NAD(P)-dependent dehydrogenase (short-subunit alcohol dehydrogenase family) [Microbacterium sp. SLBN-154]
MVLNALSLLEGRQIIVVGGTGNVGFFLVKTFASAGAKVVVTSRSTKKVDRLRERLGRDLAGGLSALLGDFGTPESAAALRAQMRAAAPEVFAGVAASASWHQVPSMIQAGFADFRHVIETRLFAHYLAAETILGLLPGEGSYATMNGDAGFSGPPYPGTGAISVSSAAQGKLMEAWGAETGGSPRVNDVVMMASIGPDGARPGSPLTGPEVGVFVAALASPLGASVHNRSIRLRSPHQVEAALRGEFGESDR